MCSKLVIGSLDAVTDDVTLQSLRRYLNRNSYEPSVSTLQE
jgi:hypothetical protein